jgi:hypothetical protein
VAARAAIGPFILWQRQRRLEQRIDAAQAFGVDRGGVFHQLAGRDTRFTTQSHANPGQCPRMTADRLRA